MNACPDQETMLGAYLDGELDSLNSASFEAHLRGCTGCAALLADQQALRSMLAPLQPAEPAPSRLRARIEADLNREAPLRRRRSVAAAPWIGGGALGAIAASLVFLLALPQVATQTLADQLVASHVRSLEADHLVDVATSDRHTVKPWFNGKLDFAPPVVDLAGKGYPLVGGRLDYIAERPVAALVYRRNLHTINVFVCPKKAARAAEDLAFRHASYAIVHWERDDLNFWAVSDVDLGALKEFRRAFEASGT